MDESADPQEQWIAVDFGSDDPQGEEQVVIMDADDYEAFAGIPGPSHEAHYVYANPEHNPMRAPPPRAAVQEDSDDEILDVVTPMSPVLEYIDNVDLRVQAAPVETEQETVQAPLRSCLSSGPKPKKAKRGVRFSDDFVMHLFPSNYDDQLARMSRYCSKMIMDKFMKIKNRKNRRRLALPMEKKCRRSNAAVSTDDAVTEERCQPPPDFKIVTPWKPQFRCCNTLYGHQKAINRVRFSPCGMYIASASDDGTIKIWSYHNASLEMTFIGHFLAVSDVFWDCTSDYVLSCSSDQTLILWSVRERKDIRYFEGHDDVVTCCAIDPVEGKRAASGGADDSVRIWNLETGAPLYVLKGHEGAVTSISFHSDGRQLASAAIDGHVLIWDTMEGTLVTSVFGDPSVDIRDPVTFVSFINCETILTSDTNSQLVIWTLDDTVALKQYSGFLNENLPLTACVMARPNKPVIVIGGSEDDKVRIWNKNSMELLQILPVSDDCKVLGIDIHPTEQIFATSCASDRDTKIRVWISP